MRTFLSITFGALAAQFGLYYLSVLFGLRPEYVNVCFLRPDGVAYDCGNYEAVLASMVRIFVWFDQHNGLVSAFSGAAVALFTAVLWRSTDKLWRTSEQQILLARNEFQSSHRPKLRLKHIWLTKQFDWQNSEPIEVNIDIVNIGNTEGYVTWINYESLVLREGERLPQRPPYDENAASPDLRVSRFRVNQLVRPGLTLPWEVCDGRTLSQVEVHAIRAGLVRLYLIGTLEYLDVGRSSEGVSLGGLRQTAFCRRLTFAHLPAGPSDGGRFETENDPDYEYEEW